MPVSRTTALLGRRTLDYSWVVLYRSPDKYRPFLRAQKRQIAKKIACRGIAAMPGGNNRPHFQRSIPELEALVDEATKMAALISLAHELDHRKTDRAAKLHAKLMSLFGASSAENERDPRKSANLSEASAAMDIVRSKAASSQKPSPEAQKQQTCQASEVTRDADTFSVGLLRDGIERIGKSERVDVIGSDEDDVRFFTRG